MNIPKMLLIMSNFNHLCPCKSMLRTKCLFGTSFVKWSLMKIMTKNYINVEVSI